MMSRSILRSHVLYLYGAQLELRHLSHGTRNPDGDNLAGTLGNVKCRPGPTGP